MPDYDRSRPLPAIATVAEERTQSKSPSAQQVAAPTALQRAASPHGAAALLQLQRELGNHYVAREVGAATADMAGASVEGDTERAIDASRGGGHALDSGMQEKVGGAFGADFSGVRVHTDSVSDSLNRSLDARAFTTGNDVYFRSGEYRPDTSSGQELIAHELTHVMQQNPATVSAKYRDEPDLSASSPQLAPAGVQTKLTVSQPGDMYEREADQMARAFVDSQNSQSDAQTDAGSTVDVQRQAEPEQEEELMAATKRVNRSPRRV